MANDGAPGLIRAVEECLPRSHRQRCLAHRSRNLQSTVTEAEWPEFRVHVKACYEAPSLEMARALRQGIVDRYAKTFPAASSTRNIDGEQVVGLGFWLREATSAGFRIGGRQLLSSVFTVPRSSAAEITNSGYGIAPSAAGVSLEWVDPQFGLHPFDGATSTCQVTIVPEPGTAALVAAGLLASRQRVAAGARPAGLAGARSCAARAAPARRPAPRWRSGA